MFWACRSLGLCITALSVAVLAVLGSPGVGTAQFGSMNGYVCQCAGFWCTFNWTSGVPDGSGCHCNTQWGPAWGYSIDLSRLNRMPDGMPDPQERGRTPPPTQPADPGDVDVGDDDCYKGLGNCAGSFRTALNRGSVSGSSGSRSAGSSRGRSRSSSRFADELYFLIEEASNRFSGLDAEFDRSTGTAEYYDVFDVPTSYDECYLRVRPGFTRVICRSEGLSYRNALGQVSEVLGDPDEQSRRDSEWVVGLVEVVLEDDDDEVVLRVYEPREQEDVLSEAGLAAARGGLGRSGTPAGGGAACGIASSGPGV